ncbi:MAG: relaxase MobL [Blastocatellales bacterium]
MRVVVSVKPTPGGGGASQATRYIAYRERDEEREGKEPRPLFSAKEDSLSFWRAERVLTEGRAPAKDELIHIAVSFREEDFGKLGHNEPARQDAFKEVSREAVSQIADELRADNLRWVAGIHRNTDHPHIHLLIYRTYLDRATGRETRLTRIPEEMLARRVNDETGAGKIVPGSFSLAFETALDRAQERARESTQTREEIDRNLTVETSKDRSNSDKERVISSDERLLEAARRNPSIAGRELIQEIILRGAERGPDERPEATDIRSALRTPSLDDPDYRSLPTQADWLGQRSQEIRDLYERGAQVKGDVLIIPAEEHELPEDRERPFITSLAYAREQMRNPEAAAEFHSLARAIAGETTDPRTEIEIFRHYFAEIRRRGEEVERAEAVERMLDEMRLLAGEMAKLETRNSIEAVSQVASFEEMREAVAQVRISERDSLPTEEHSLEWPQYETEPVGEERESETITGAFNTAARKVNLSDESLRFPAELSLEAKERLVTQTLPTIDRLLENGNRREAIIAGIDGAIYKPELPENEQEERRKVGVFLKDYVNERLKDPETRALNHSAAFRLIHARITETHAPEELNRVAEDFLRENLRRSAALRRHQTDPEHHPTPDVMPLTVRERNLLFFGRAPEHHMPEMRDLRHYWGWSRAERAERVRELHEGRLAPSATLETMLSELDSRRTLQAVRHYQASILNEEMQNPGKLNLKQIYDRLPPHERTYLIERIEERKQEVARLQTPPREQVSDRTSIPPTNRPFGAVPRESNSYREYMASMGAIESRLLNEAVRQRQTAHGYFVANQDGRELSIAEARSLLPHEEQIRIRDRARNLAWKQIAPPEVFAQQPEPAARRLSDTVANLQEEAQRRARLAHQALDEFVREKIGFNDRNEPLSTEVLSKLESADAQRLRALEEYAARMREELYRGFESLDALRGELEKPRGSDEIARNKQPELTPDSDRILSLKGNSDGKDLQLVNGAYFALKRNSTEDNEPARVPNHLQQRSWFVDSDQKWHFDSLPAPRDATSDRDFNIDSSRDDIGHDLIYDR